jgi:hypothetical protein
MAQSKKVTIVHKNGEALDLPEVEVWDTLPDFRAEHEEADFWATHALGESFFDVEWDDCSEGEASFATIPLRFDAATIGRLKKLCERRGKSHKALLEGFVLERLEEEDARRRVTGV